MDESEVAAIAFGTDGWRATLDEFTEPRVRVVGQAVAAYLDDEGIEGPVVVGYDARESSPGFADALADVLADNGRDVVLPERDCPTPVVAWTIATGGDTGHEFAGGFMLTASHNPPEYNGVKFIPSAGAPAMPAVTNAIESRLAAAASDLDDEGRVRDPDTDPGVVRETDLVEPFLDHTASFVDADLDGLTVAYDGMHGSGRGVTDELVERAGADVIRLRCERDADFGGSAPEPTAHNVGELVDLVTAGEADLGLVNDGDADRVGVVTPERGYLDPNHFLAASYEHVLDDRGTDGDVVRTVSTSSLVDRVAEAHGRAVHETAVGFKWVAAAMSEHDAVVGGEESGGFGLTAHLRNQHGVFVGLRAAAAHAQRPYDERVDALVDAHGEIHQDRLSIDCPDERKAPVLDALADALPEEVAGTAVADVNDVDGFKIVLADDTWVLVRPSGTEPKLRLYAEAGSAEHVEALLVAGRDLVSDLV